MRECFGEVLVALGTVHFVTWIFDLTIVSNLTGNDRESYLAYILDCLEFLQSIT